MAKIYLTGWAVKVKCLFNFIHLQSVRNMVHWVDNVIVRPLHFLLIPKPVHDGSQEPFLKLNRNFQPTISQQEHHLSVKMTLKVSKKTRGKPVYPFIIDCKTFFLDQQCLLHASRWTSTLWSGSCFTSSSQCVNAEIVLGEQCASSRKHYCRFYQAIYYRGSVWSKNLLNELECHGFALGLSGKNPMNHLDQ